MASREEDSETDFPTENTSSLSLPSNLAVEPLPEINLSNNASNDEYSDNLLPEINNDKRFGMNDQEESRHLENYDDPFADEDSYYTRPNRYFGPASTWRNWTEEERTIVESLGRQRAQDLSVHLYNAHVLKARARKEKRVDSRKGKHRASSTDEKEEDPRFTPPPTWTAWPLPAAEVPRERLVAQLGSDDGFGGQKAERPGTMLEECIIATAARVARERWKARKWEWQRSAKEESSASLQTTTAEEQQLSNKEANKDEEQYQEENRDIPIFSSQAFIAINESSDEEANNSKNPNLEDERTYQAQPTTRPVSLADDDKARYLFHAATRHIVAKLDELLTGLHKARQAYAVKPSARERYDETTDETTDTDRSRSRKRKRGFYVDSDASSMSVVSASSRLKRQKEKRLGLRDWSDVLGMAALLGWNQNVVQRASERCADIFKQDMLFRTFHEGGAAKEGGFFTEVLASGREPEMECGSDVEPEARESHQDIDFKLNPEILRSRCCPYKRCKRHTDPFGQRSGLQRHLETIHANDTPLSQSAAASPFPSSGADTGISCPVQGCEREHYSFSTAPKMYKHVKTQHPQVDIKQLKKMERERRGRSRPRSNQRTHICPVETCPWRDMPFRYPSDLSQHMKRKHPGVVIEKIGIHGGHEDRDREDQTGAEGHADDSVENLDGSEN